MKEVNRKMTAKLKTLFKLRTLEELDELKRRSGVDVAYISRFKKEFFKKEGVASFLSFQIEIRAVERLREYYQEEAKFLALYQDLFDSFSIYLAYRPFDKFDDSIQPIIWNFFESKEEFIDICTDNLREKEWIYLFIPDLELMIFGAPGLQNIVIFQSDRGKDILKECVEKQGLFLVAGCGS